MYAMRKGLRTVALMLVAAVGLSACATTDSPSTNAPSRFNETVALPTAIGAFSGAVIGGLLCDKKNRAACIGGGAAAGALIGGSAGYLVALQNKKFANREEELRARTNAARQEVERFDRIIAATNGTITGHKREIAQLQERYRRGQASRDDYQKQQAAISSDIEGLKTNINAIQKNIDAIKVDLAALGPGGTSGLAVERDKLLHQKDILQKQLAALIGLREGVPTS